MALRIAPPILGPIGKGPAVGDTETRRKNLAEGLAVQEASPDNVPCCGGHPTS
ncbi:hypothetical protein C8E89_13443 [Mycolicibacterium moriokaense]|uniref:Uncharacterized protein n=1 Tax=Mycolicibacterium moriokaense TaxID=39691 RepID=A0A318HEU7_9MYCO|nr:hypothetical protein C8E89_13443 [Mycolicibacterium moriokaense]